MLHQIVDRRVRETLGHGRGAELLVALDLGILGFFCHFCKSPNHMMEIYLNRSDYSLTQRPERVRWILPVRCRLADNIKGYIGLIHCEFCNTYENSIFRLLTCRVSLARA